MTTKATDSFILRIEDSLFSKSMHAYLLDRGEREKLSELEGRIRVNGPCRSR
jgi:hypothetical protein